LEEYVFAPKHVELLQTRESKRENNAFERGEYLDPGENLQPTAAFIGSQQVPAYILTVTDVVRRPTPSSIGPCSPSGPQACRLNASQPSGFAPISLSSLH
jgi:hypothetical protein